MVRLRQCKLVVLTGPDRGREHVVHGEVIRVGKGADNDLVISQETVSRNHFEIVRESKGYLLRDLQSTNGTFLDGAEIREAYIRAGAVIAAGAAELKFSPFEERIEVPALEKERLGDMVGRSLAMRRMFGLVERIAPTNATVLIEGERGSGKSMLARTFHRFSGRAVAPFVAVHCGAVPGTLVESEIFGHEEGAFTGASSRRVGALEAAKGGTVFLDDLGELSLDVQSKLLRALEKREFRRIGGASPIRLELRIIVGTRMDLRSEIEKGKFLEDLYFRINVVPVVSPALRERPDDIPLLVEHFLRELTSGDESPASVGKAALDALIAHDWPGNLTELRNVLSLAHVARVDPATLVMPFSGLERGSGETLAVKLSEFSTGMSFREQKERWTEEFESRYLRWLLEGARGNISKAARTADMDRKYLHRLLKKHAIDPRDV